MTRHIADTPSPLDDGKRTAAFLKIDRRAGPASASRSLQERPKHDARSGRLKAFTRIERGQKA